MSLIDYKNVDIYQGEKLVLQDVNFHVDEGEFMYIIGSVGSGKSSLLKTFYCELDIWHEENKEEENAEVLERDIFNLKRKEVPALRREMGIIFQDFKLLHEMTVRKNLQFVLKSTGWKSQKDINERIESVLTDVGMLDKIDKLPHELSGGEQQRVAIARAIQQTQNHYRRRAHRKPRPRHRRQDYRPAQRHQHHGHGRSHDHPQHPNARPLPRHRLPM